ncbi:MAG: rhomboid family intramembrane serine protease [Planctomycetes bacterium]|nr:rhomboid family intramembrane serine protease [Planctomycetota bacterium]
MYRTSYTGSGWNFFQRPVPRVIKILLGANLGVFALQYGLSLAAGSDLLGSWLALRPQAAVEGLRVWQFLTYAYLHSLDNPFHILLNMLFLWMFGAELGEYFGARRFLVFYHLCAFMGAVWQVIAAYAQNTTLPVLGASGAIYGIFTVYALLFPNRQVLLFLLIPIRMKYLILILVGIDFLSGTRFLSPGTAHFCHLGGVAGGLAFHFLHRRLESFLAGFEARSQARETAREAAVRETVDRLLEKIRREGMHKLTAREKRFLNHASKLYQKDDPRG